MRCGPDYDNDGDPDLIVVGEWMPITIFKNTDNRFKKIDAGEVGLMDTEGWWYSLEAADFDGDGDLDLVAGNIGLNHKYRASGASPFEVLGANLTIMVRVISHWASAIMAWCTHSAESNVSPSNCAGP